MTHWTDDLVRLRACYKAVEWARPHASLDAAWPECTRGDWMLWYAGRKCPPPQEAPTPERARLVRAACACAMTARPYWPAAARDACQRAIDTARAWCRGRASLDDV
ncbi:MAG: hypothetical protein ABIL09_05275, partial [Gemmatimonadota bacterium]